MAVLKRVLPPTYLLISLLLMIVLHFVFPVKVIAPLPWSLLGLLLLGAGVVINIIAERTFKEMKTTVRPFAKASVLVTERIYRVSRNPMYLGMALVLVGTAILLGTLMPFIIIPIFVWLINTLFIKSEERILQEEFGLRWLQYSMHVRRWI